MGRVMSVITLVSRTEFLSPKNRCSGDFPFSFLFITPSLPLPLSLSENTQHRKQSHLLTKSVPRGGTRLKTRLPFTPLQRSDCDPFRQKRVLQFQACLCCAVREGKVHTFELFMDVCPRSKACMHGCSVTSVVSDSLQAHGL